jgi:hypothetical protein
MLGATQKQLFEMGPSTPAKYDSEGNLIAPASTGEITGFKPYTPYSTDPNKYVAGFQPLQQQAMQATGQLQTPGQFGDATALAGASGLGSLGLAGQAAGAGQQFAQQAQNPMAMQGYMSPYMQNVVDYQKAQAARDYNIGQGVRKAQAVGQGAFGGNRAALMEAEAQRSLTNQLQGITATGSQKAFEDAQRQQQFGAQLGLQGIQAGLQGMGQAGQAAGTLGQLGAQQLGAQKDIIGMKSQMGAQQQALEQQKINQAIQDWANTQQYPLMQLGVMSNMLRGLPMQSTNTQSYVAAPNALTQGIGTVGALGYLGKTFQGGKEGGLPSEFKPTTGIKSYRRGGISDNVEGILYDMSPDELQDYIEESSSPIAKRLANKVLRDKVGKASGGIIAFSNPNDENNQGVVKDEDKVKYAPGTPFINPNKAANKLTDDQIDIIRARGSLPLTPRQAEAKAASLQPPPVGLPKDFPSELSYEADKARSDFQQKVIEQGGQLKPRQMGTSTAPMTDEQRIAGFKAALNQTVPASAGASPPPGGVKDVPPPGGTVSARAPATAPGAAGPAPAGITSASPIKTGNPDLDAYFANVLKEANAPQPTTEEIAAKRNAFIGPDTYTPKERARLMSEKTSTEAEAKYEFNMNMAKFFADWGTRPGAVLTAGLSALRDNIPNLVTSEKNKRKALREIDKSMNELEKSERLERAGQYDKAEEIKKADATRLKDKLSPIITYAASKYSSDANVKAAAIRAEGGGENKLLAKIEADIGREKNQKVYQDTFKWANMTPPKDASDAVKNKIADAKTQLDKFERDFEARREQARKGVPATSTAAPTAPGGSLVPGKDGSFDYVSKS